MRIVRAHAIEVSVLCVFLADLFTRLNTFSGVSNGSTEIVFSLSMLAAGCYILLLRGIGLHAAPPSGKKAVIFFVLWMVFSFLHGAFRASGYWDWKALVVGYLPTVFIPLAIVVGLRTEYFFRYIFFVIKVIFPLALLAIPYASSADHELYPRLVSMVMLVLVFLPYVKRRLKWWILAVALSSLVFDPAYRINVLRLSFVLGMITFLHYFKLRKVCGSMALNMIFACMMLAPSGLLYLGVSGQYNVFSDSDRSYFDIDVFEVGGAEGNSGADSNLSTDTRTLLYVEVIGSMISKGSSFFLGEGGGAGYQTELFQDADVGGRGRGGTEVGFLNMILFSGGVGASAYFLVILVSAYFAINRSSNYLAKTLGLWVAFRWGVFFVEDIASVGMNMFSLWVAIGLCLSNDFRRLTDAQVRSYLESPISSFQHKVANNRISR